MKNADAICPSISLDLRGISCPAPLVSVYQMLDDLKEGDTLLLISDCSGTEDDLNSWVKQTGNQLLQIDEEEGGGRAYHIQKGELNPVNIVLDVRGATCPWPVIEAARLLKGMNDNEVLKLISSCESVDDDILTWIQSTSYRLLGKVRNSQNVFLFYIQK